METPPLSPVQLGTASSLLPVDSSRAPVTEAAFRNRERIAIDYRRSCVTQSNRDLNCERSAVSLDDDNRSFQSRSKPRQQQCTSATLAQRQSLIPHSGANPNSTLSPCSTLNWTASTVPTTTVPRPNYTTSASACDADNNANDGKMTFMPLPTQPPMAQRRAKKAPAPLNLTVTSNDCDAVAVSVSQPSSPYDASWFTAAPPTPPVAVRLRLQMDDIDWLELRRIILEASSSLRLSTKTSSTPNTMMTMREATANASTLCYSNDGLGVQSHSQFPLNTLFISNSSSVMDLKHMIVERLSTYGIAPILPHLLHLCVSYSIAGQHNDVHDSALSSALGLEFAASDDPASAVKELQPERLLYEEGVGEGDVITIRICNPAHLFWS